MRSHVSCCPPLTAAPQGALSDTTYTIEVAEGVDITLNADDVTQLGSANTLVKTGKGRLIVSTDLKSAGYDGEIQVAAGYLRAAAVGALGGTAKGTTIVKDATLEIYDPAGGTAQRATMFGGEAITFEGSGVDGHGAIYAVNAGRSYIGGTANYTDTTVITMSGDATVGYAGEEGFDGTFGLVKLRKFNMGMHTLTVQGGSNSGFSYVYDGDSAVGVSNPGHIIVKKECGTFTLSYTRLGANKSNTFTVEDGLTLLLDYQLVHFWGTWQPTGWTLITEGDLTVVTKNNPSSAGDGGGSGWAGPIVLGGTLTCEGSASPFCRFDGQISGTGGITLKTGTLKMLGHNRTKDTPHVANTYTGQTLVKSGATLYVESMVLVPAENGQFVVENGAHVTYSDPAMETSATTARAVAAAQSVCTNEAFVVGETDFLIDSDVEVPPYTVPLIGPMTFSGIFGEAMGFELASTLSGGVALRQDAKTKTIVTTGGEAGQIFANGGTIDIAAGATVNVGENSVYADGTDPQVGRVSVHGTLTLASGAAYAIRTARGPASSTAKSRGIFEMFEGSSVTAHFDRNFSDPAFSSGGGYTPRAQGSYVIHGGTLHGEHDGIEVFPADAHSAYYAVEKGGTWLDKGDMRVARQGTAIYHVNGGTYKNDPAVHSGGTYSEVKFGVLQGTADVLVDNGGQMLFKDANFRLGGEIESWMAPQNGGIWASLGVEGEGSLVDLDLTQGMYWLKVDFACCKGSKAVVGVRNGGTLRAPKINRATSDFKGNGDGTQVPLTDNFVFVAADGGTVQIAPNTNPQMPKDMFRNFRAGSDHVVSYPGGLTVQADTDKNLGVGVEPPSGNGIKSIALPDAVKALAPWAYIGAPRVVITDTTGVGAAAVALFDSTNGVVTGIKVTSPGINYTSPTVKLMYGGYASDFTFTDGIELEAFASGGLTKTGAKTLVLDATNTYAGVTTVAEGTLKLGADDVIKASSGVLMAGGKLDVNNTAFDRPLLGGCGEIVNAGATLVAGPSLAFVAADLAAKRTLTTASGIVLAAGSTVSVDDLDALVASGRHSFTLMTSETGIAGDLPTLGGPFVFEGSPWSVRFTADRKSLRLNDGYGLAIIVR